MRSSRPPPRPPADHARRVCRGMKRVLLFALRAALAKHLRVTPMDFSHAVPSVTPCSTTGDCSVSSLWSDGPGSSPHKYRQKQTGPVTLWHRLRCDHYGVREQLGTAISAPLRSFPFGSWPFAKSQACSQRKARYYAGSLSGGRLAQLVERLVYTETIRPFFGGFSSLRGVNNRRTAPEHSRFCCPSAGHLFGTGGYSKPSLRALTPLPSPTEETGS